MLLIVGLGNPGSKYAQNRHNIGFMAVDRIAEDHGFAGWKSKFQGQINEGRLGSEKTVLLKPETFMNRSGQSVGEAMRFFKLAPEDVIIFHDEIAAVQAFPVFNDKVLGHTLHSVRDAFAINYGTGGIGAEIFANRLRNRLQFSNFHSARVVLILRQNKLIKIRKQFGHHSGDIFFFTYRQD